MAEGPGYRVKYRRRREGKTDYRARRILATSGKPRFVVRPSLRNVRVQVIRSELEGDHVEVGTSTRELVERFGWRGGGKNTSACYLLGLIAGYKALLKGIDTSMLDMELRSPTKGARVFAVAQGAVDSGLKIAYDEKVLPSEDRIRGEHISNYARLLQSDSDAYRERFSDYIRRGLKPEELPEHFEEVKARVREAFAR